MNDSKTLNERYETIGWGALFILFGVVWLIPAVPDGTLTLGIGAILLGLNLARYLRGIPANWFTTTLGAIAFVLGGIDLLRSVLGIPIDWPLFPILLVAVGAILVARAITRVDGQANDHRLTNQPRRD